MPDIHSPLSHKSYKIQSNFFSYGLLQVWLAQMVFNEWSDAIQVFCQTQQRDTFLVSPEKSAIIGYILGARYIYAQAGIKLAYRYTMYISLLSGI